MTFLCMLASMDEWTDRWNSGLVFRVMSTQEGLKFLGDRL